MALRRCDICGADLPAGLMERLCAKCLFRPRQKSEIPRFAAWSVTPAGVQYAAVSAWNGFFQRSYRQNNAQTVRRLTLNKIHL